MMMMHCSLYDVYSLLPLEVVMMVVPPLQQPQVTVRLQALPTALSMHLSSIASHVKASMTMMMMMHHLLLLFLSLRELETHLDKKVDTECPSLATVHHFEMHTYEVTQLQQRHQHTQSYRLAYETEEVWIQK